jgi:plastocyanin
VSAGRSLVAGSLLLAVAAAGALLALALAASPAAGENQAAGPVAIRVTAGKPTEYAFTLSKTSVPLGSVVFTVVNRGKLKHSFTIAGQKTPALAPGKRAKLTIVFTRGGDYTYTSAVAGQSAKGMKGVFVVTGGAAAPAPKVTTPAGGGEAGASTTGDACTNPSNTAVSVKLYEWGFILSQSTIPCGTVTFNVLNVGEIAHTFDIEGTSSRGFPAFTGGVILLPNEAETHTVTFATTGSYKYQCDRHFDQGVMIGSVKVVNGPA